MEIGRKHACIRFWVRSMAPPKTQYDCLRILKETQGTGSNQLYTELDPIFKLKKRT